MAAVPVPDFDQFLSSYRRRRSMNAAALLWVVREVQASLDMGHPISDGTQRRMRLAVDEYESLQCELLQRTRQPFGGGAA